jgi:serine/threonine protein kinase
MSTPSNRASTAETEAASTPGAPTPDRQPASEPHNPLVGRILSGRYFIERVIGEGGMGAVYQAEHTHMHKRLAVKVLHPAMSRLPEVVARFEREALAAAHIEHPNVAAATDFGKLDDGSFFLVLEYVEGKSLRDAIAPGPMELGRAFHVTRQISSALARAHALGIVHRDLKPENVMLVRRDEDDDFVKVLDFGIAKVPVGSLVGEHKVTGQALTQIGMVYGTPEYMAPEQALGQAVDARADLYALGVMMFEMITGKRPFDHDSKVTLLGMHVTAPIPKMSVRAPEADVPPEAEAIVTRLLAKEADARYADAKELIDSLDSVAMLLAERGRIADPFPPKSMVGPPRASSASLEGSQPQMRVSAGDLSLSSGAVATPSRRGLVAGAVASFERVLASAPPWMSRTRMAVGASVLAVGLVFVGVAAVTSRHEEPVSAVPPRSGGSATVAAPVPHAPDPGADEAVRDAQTRIDGGEYKAAIDELLPVEKGRPDRVDVHMLLMRAYTAAHNPQSALREADLWLGLDANAAADVHLQEDVRNAALLHDTQDDAFTLLDSRMGTRGIDLLYDIAYGASGRQYPQAAARAKKDLDAPEVRPRASPALALLLDFRQARTCEQKHALLEAARDQGDSRLLPQLQPYEAARGCGFFGRADCYPCMHRDHLLEEAKQAILERAKGQP